MRATHVREAQLLRAIAALGRDGSPGGARPVLPDDLQAGSVDASTSNGDVLACGVHVADVVALILDFEERDELASLDDIAAMFGIELADVQAARSHYNQNLRRLRPVAHARRRVLPGSA
jgi:hypothetical protein